MNKRLMNHIIFLFLALSIAIPAPLVAMNKDESQGGFKEFREKLAQYAKVPGKEARFLYKWGMKKYKRQETTPEDNARAKKILTGAGISVVVFLTIIAGTLTAIKMHSDYKKKTAVRPSKPDLNLTEKNLDNSSVLVAIGNGASLAKIEEMITDANINGIDKNGATALMIATVAGRPEVVEMLLKKKANKELKTPKDKLTALDMAKALKSYHAQMANAAKGEWYTQLNKDLVEKFATIEKMLKKNNS